jgi:capsular polysaccharide biosynthesis protein
MDSLSLILKIHKEHPGTKFVLYLQKARTNQSIDNFYELLFIVLNGEGVNYKTISTIVGKDYAPVYKFNNYVRIDRVVNIHHLVSFLDIKYMADIVVKHCKKYMNVTDSVEPFRKLYISRGNAPSNLGPIVDGYPDYKDDRRMNDAWKLEEFFISMGYDAFSPERHFGSIMEQVVYMNEVKTLASITSSGLANMVFMQPNQTIIEIQAELVQVMRFDDDTHVYPNQRIHNYYSTLAFMPEHTHITIPSRRDPDKVIKTLTSGQLSYLI